MHKPSSTTNYPGKTFLPLVSEKLAPEIVKKANVELNETPERQQEAVKELRRLIHAESDFRPIMDDKFLIRFLRVKKYDSQKAFNMLKNYYTFKIRYSKIITDFLPSEIKHVLEQNAIGPLPYRDSEGRAIAVGRLGSFDFGKASADELFAAILVCAEAGIGFETTQISGSVLILDCKGASLKTVRELATPKLLYRAVRVMQDCFPARLKALHVVHEPFYANVVLNIAKTFLSEKMKRRIHFHGNNMKSLHKAIPSCLLPQEFEGDLGPFDSTEFVELVLNNEKTFERNSKYGFKEKKAHFIRKKSSLSLGLYA